MKEKGLLNEAIAVASIAHIGQVDKGGCNYVLHPLRVMMSLSGEKEQVAGVLHDVVEYTYFTMESLKEHFKNKGFDVSEEIYSEKVSHNNNNKKILESLL